MTVPGARQNDSHEGERARTVDLNVRPPNRLGLRCEDNRKFTTAGGKRSRTYTLRVRLGNRVERDLERVARGGLDLRHDVGVTVVEDDVRTERADEVVVTRGRGGDNLIAREMSELDSEMADGSYSMHRVLVQYIRVTGEPLQLPP